MSIYVPPAIGGPIVGSTPGSLLYADSNSNFAQDNANAFWDAVHHRLGIGTVPGNTLHVVSTLTPLNIGGQSVKTGIQLSSTASITADTTGTAIGSATGLSYASNFSIGSLKGIESDVIVTNSSGTVSNIYGFVASISNSTGSPTNSFGFWSKYSGTGAGTLTNRYGHYVADPVLTGGALITNNYGVYIEAPVAGGTLNYGLYSAGGPNYFGGKVGIGDTAPGVSLSVKGSGTQFVTIASTGTGTPQLALEASPAATPYLALYTVSNHNLYFGTNNGDQKVVIDTTGRVGIGQTSASYLLDVNGLTHSKQIYAGTSTPTVQRALTISDTGDSAAMQFEAHGTSGRGYGFFTTDASSSTLALGNAGSFTIFDQTANAPRISITSAGNVGIGALNATHLLHLVADDAFKPTTNTWTTVSDRRAKTQIQPYSVGSAVLRKLQPRSFVYNGEFGTERGAQGVGFIANEGALVAPEMFPRYDLGKGPAVYHYQGHNLAFILLNGWKEHDSRLATIEAKLGI